MILPLKQTSGITVNISLQVHITKLSLIPKLLIVDYDITSELTW